MKTFAITFTVIVLSISFAVWLSDQPSSECSSFAKFTGEKLYKCGMVSDYASGTDFANKLLSKLTKGEVSADECTFETHHVSEMACNEFEMMMNVLIERSQNNRTK